MTGPLLLPAKPRQSGQPMPLPPHLRPGTLASHAEMLLATPQTWRVIALNHLGVTETSLAKSRHDPAVDLKPYATALGYAVTALDPQIASRLTFTTDQHRKTWLKVWDSSYGISDPDAMAALLGKSKRATTTWLRAVDLDRPSAIRATWLRIGLTWLAGGIAPANMPDLAAPPSQNSRIRTLETRLREITNARADEAVRVTECGHQLLGLCVRQQQHAKMTHS